MGWGVEELTARVTLSPAIFRADEGFFLLLVLPVTEWFTVRAGTAVAAFLLEVLLLVLPLWGTGIVVCTPPSNS